MGENVKGSVSGNAIDRLLAIALDFCAFRHKKKSNADIKFRSWGFAEMYGISPISEQGKTWVNNWPWIN